MAIHIGQMEFYLVTSLACAAAAQHLIFSRNNGMDGILRVEHIISLNQDYGLYKAAGIVITNHRGSWTTKNSINIIIIIKGSLKNQCLALLCGSSICCNLHLCHVIVQSITEDFLPNLVYQGQPQKFNRIAHQWFKLQGSVFPWLLHRELNLWTLHTAVAITCKVPMTAWLSQEDLKASWAWNRGPLQMKGIRIFNTVYKVWQFYYVSMNSSHCWGKKKTYENIEEKNRLAELVTAKNIGFITSERTMLADFLSWKPELYSVEYGTSPW